MSGNTGTEIWIAGATAAFTIGTLTYPLDTIKTRVQSQNYRRLYVHEGSNVVKRAALFRGLYQGIGTALLASLPASGAFFTTYEGVKSLLTRFNPPNPFSSTNNVPLLPTPFIHSFASGVAELVSCAFYTPVEVIKQNAQMIDSSLSRKDSPGVRNRLTASATFQVLRRFRHRPLALWRGYFSLVGRNMPFTATYFPLLEYFKSVLVQRRRRQKSKGVPEGQPTPPPTVLEAAAIMGVSAGTAGTIIATILTPLDLVKTRIMLSAGEHSDTHSGSSNAKSQDGIKKGKIVNALGAFRSHNSSDGHRKSSLQVAREIVRDDGWRGLFRGGALRAALTLMGSGLFMGMYEGARLHLERRRPDGGSASTRWDDI